MSRGEARRVVCALTIHLGGPEGWSYLHDGKPKYCHNLAGLTRLYVEVETAVEAGEQVQR